MDNIQALYEAAKDDLQTIAEQLFGFAESQVAKHGAFLPFGATLEADNDVKLHAAAGEKDLTNSTEVLPLLQEGLRESCTVETKAVAVCEWVKIIPENDRETDAIKVLVEHRNGLVVAFYLPMRKKVLRGWQSGEMMVVPASREIGVWARPPT